MKRWLKTSLLVLGLLMLIVVSLFFWIKSPWTDSANYYTLKTYSESSTPLDTLTVMTYNLGYLSGMTNNLPVERPSELFESNLNSAKSLLNYWLPDIVGFQEIDLASKRSYDQNQLDSLALGLNYHQSYASVNWNKRYVPFPYWPPTLHFGKMLSGQAVLSRYPIVTSETIVLEKPINAPFYYNAFYLDRLVQVVDVQVGKRTIKVINLHLEAFDKETRERQALVVRQLYESFASQMPVLLIGDFNSQPPWEPNADEAMKTILGAENIASAITKEMYNLNKQSHYTFNTDNSYQMIDYVLYNPNFIEPIAATVIQEAGQISDHFPVALRFTFK